MMFETTPVKDLLIFRPKRHGDARGFFAETWSRDAFAAEGLSSFQRGMSRQC